MKKLVLIMSLFFSCLFSQAVFAKVTFPAPPQANHYIGCYNTSPQSNNRQCTYFNGAFVEGSFDSGSCSGTWPAVNGNWGMTTSSCGLSCPVNSHENQNNQPLNYDYVSNHCETNQNYSALNTNGTWTVVPTGSECPSGHVYDSQAGTCSSSVVGTASLVQAGIALGAAILGGVAIISGAPLIAIGGTFVSLLAAIGSITSLPDDFTSPSSAISSANLPLQVTLAPAAGTPPTTNNNTPAGVVKLADGTLAPSGGGVDNVTWSMNGTNATATAQVGSQSRVVAEITNDGTKAVFYNPADSDHSIPVQTTVEVYPDQSMNISQAANLGVRDQNNDATKLAAAVTHSYDSNGTLIGTTAFHSSTNQNGTPAGGANGLNENTPLLTDGTGYESPGGKECIVAPGKPCASQQTQSEILAELKKFTDTSGFDVNAKLNGLDGRIDGASEQGNDGALSTLTGYLDNLPISNALTNFLPASPWAALKGNANANCKLPFTLLNQSFEVSICEALPYLHTALNYMFFVLMCFGIFRLLFNSPE